MTHSYEVIRGRRAIPCGMGSTGALYDVWRLSDEDVYQNASGNAHEQKEDEHT